MVRHISSADRLLFQEAFHDTAYALMQNAYEIPARCLTLPIESTNALITATRDGETRKLRVLLEGRGNVTVTEESKYLD